MVSPTAIADIKAAIARGVKLTPEDIIRLNALGLRHDRAKSGVELRIMPRVSWLGDVAFREPTVGHEIWMRGAADVFNLSKAETLVKVRAFCLATDPADLPDLGMGHDALRELVMRFCKERIGFYTLGQVAAALAFAEDGDDPAAAEVPAPSARRPSRRAQPAGELCYEVGLLRQGILLRLGSYADLARLTVSGLEAIVTEAMKADDRWGADFAKSLVSRAFGEYKRTLEAIVRERSEENAEGVHHAHGDAAKSDDQADREAEAVQSAGSAGGTV